MTKSGKLTSTLGVGPMSSETIEAVFRYSHFHRVPLMLISSKNQIDHAGGYVNKWTTKDYMAYVRELRNMYSNSNVIVCRDHCGPGFNGVHDMEDTYATIKADIENGFDLIHIDFCHFKGSPSEQREESKKAIEFALSLNPRILLEIGTDENVGANYSLPNLKEIEREIDYFTEFCQPEFYVVQTGSLVMEINQVGNFNKAFVNRISNTLTAKGLKLKEHNADYLSKEDIIARKDLVDAQNIAPQLGVIQTHVVLTKALIYGIPIEPFLQTAYEGKKWKKWLKDNTYANKMLCSVIAGHYHFASPEYKHVLSEIAKREDITETIIDRLTEVIDHYVGK